MSEAIMKHKRWAFLFPGQGAQYPQMGRDFYEMFPIAKETFQEADDLLQENFSRLIFEGTSTELTSTKNSQVAIFIVSTALLRTVREQFPSLEPYVCAGLSLGEYTALVASGKISFTECLKLVRARALAMHEACQLKKGVMQVVLGLSEESVAEAICSIPQWWIANLNCPEQVVIAGVAENMSLAANALKEKGAKRILPLDVSGAFHSGLMQPAQDKLAPKIAEVKMTESSICLVMNVSGDFVKDSEGIRRCLFEQVVSPVRWEKAVRTMMAHGVNVYLEIGPGKTLNGMNKRIGVNAETISIEKVSDLEQLSKYVEAYATTEC